MPTSLADSVREGEFERDGRSKILYLDTLVVDDGASPRCRLTREQFEIASKGAASGWVPSLAIKVLNCCWLRRELARRWLESHGYHWSPRLEPPPKRPTLREIDEFDLQLGWIPIAAALEIIKGASEDFAWEHLKRAIQLESLPARCHADGFTRDLEPHWLDFLAFDYVDDVLWFDRQKAWHAKVSVPHRVGDIVVPIARCANCGRTVLGRNQALLGRSPMMPASNESFNARIGRSEMSYRGLTFVIRR